MRNGNSTAPALFAFLAGVLSVFLTRCCSSWCSRRRRIVQNRKLKVDAKTDDLNRLLEEAHDDPDGVVLI